MRFRLFFGKSPETSATGTFVITITKSPEKAGIAHFG